MTQGTPRIDTPTAEISIAESASAIPPIGRRYDLDALRVLAFGLLILYHVGMFYVTWGWHVKSRFAGPTIEPLMLLVNPWRLALLFFISGVAIRFASDRRGRGAFARSRLLRLGLPLVFGMAVVVAPQSYFQLREAGVIEPGFLAFWPDYLSFEQRFEIITPTWNHLWYVAYLLVYSLLLAPFLPWLRGRDGVRMRRLAELMTGGRLRLLLLPVIPFVIYGFTLDPRFETTHALFDDWANHAHRFTVLMFGYVVAKSPSFWGRVDRVRGIAYGGVAVLGGTFTLFRLTPGGLDWVNAVPAAAVAWGVGQTLYSWFVILSLLAVAQRYFNRPSPRLRYFTEAVYPYYILHQTIIVAAGYGLTRLDLPAAVEVSAVIVATVGGCALGHALIRRVGPLRPWFGLRPRSAPASGARDSRPAVLA